MNTVNLNDFHTQHCFDYLSQSILCARDLTIEWARIESHGWRFQVDGWGIPHQCKDSEAILAWEEVNHRPANIQPLVFISDNKLAARQTRYKGIITNT